MPGLAGLEGFNPRSREGSDISATTGQAWGSSFNPRSREGSDRQISAVRRASGTFQSTLP